MNRNVLKIIAVISMLLDHIGAYIFPDAYWLRCIGRLAFPIFAIFIAEGMRYTRSRKRYVLTLLVFAIISQIPYGFLREFYYLNILFTFLIAIFAIFLIENYKKNETLYMIYLLLLGSVLLFVEFLNIVDYGIFGVLLILVFYFVKDKKLSLSLGAACLVLLTLKMMLFAGFTLRSTVQFLSILSLLLLYFYNGNKGKVNLKWLFYIFYPLHLLVILIITLI